MSATGGVPILGESGVSDRRPSSTMSALSWALVALVGTLAELDPLKVNGLLYHPALFDMLVSQGWTIGPSGSVFSKVAAFFSAVVAVRRHCRVASRRNAFKGRKLLSSYAGLIAGPIRNFSSRAWVACNEPGLSSYTAMRSSPARGCSYL